MAGFRRRPQPDAASPDQLLIYPLADRDGRKMTELVVASPGGRELSLSEADFLEGLALQAAVALKTRAITSATSSSRACSRI
jgi:hypothetical protein